MNKLWFLGVLILILFTAGIVLFFAVFPAETITLNNLISYLSSLSTITMVIVVIFTTQQQINEMKVTSTLQIQPLPVLKPLKKSYFEKPKFFYSPESPVPKLENRIFLYVEIENIGNGGATAIDIIPELKFHGENGKILSKKYVSERIDSLKPNQKEEVEFMFVDWPETEQSKLMWKNFLDKNEVSEIELTLLYKNALGASFREKIMFEIWFYMEDRAQIRSCLKLLETAKIEFAEDIRKIADLEKAERDEEAHTIRQKINTALSQDVGCKDIGFSPVTKVGSFSVLPISTNEYQKLAEKQVGYGHLLGVVRDKDEKGR